jgi:hypothetical protein
MKFTDKRRKHQHYKATITFSSGEQFARTYTDKQRAHNFANRQKRSPVVKATRVAEVNRG